MIRLTKGPTPTTLATNTAAWTQELLDLLGRGVDVPVAVWRRYADAQIKAAVVRDSFGKCVYCESKVPHVSFGDIEHMRPKALYPSLTYEWRNLAFVCSRCNNAKRNRFDETVPPINPFEDEPRQFLIALGEWIWPVPGNDGGRETIALTNLNRPELLLQRRKRTEQVQALAEAYVRCEGTSAKAALLDQIREELSTPGEYAFVCRAAALALGVIADTGLQSLDRQAEP